MPRKNTIKTYVEGGHYHIYNRGVEKRKIFLDKQDYLVFLRFLKEYLLPPEHVQLKSLLEKVPRRKPINCHDEIGLLAYCLMPNHFHLFVKQKTKEGLKPFMKAVSTNYAMYFNHKYDRVGPLFQGTYKAAYIDKESYFLHISRYIHRNPLDLDTRVKPLYNYPYSSYKYYLSGKNPDWLNTKEILKLFRSSRNLFPKDVLSYQSFVENYDADDPKRLRDLVLDDYSYKG